MVKTNQHLVANSSPATRYGPTGHARKNGFTLIELLVVIAIIAILAAILFPVFSRAREMARRTSCQGNMKQISLGVRQYMQDYDEFYPQKGNTGYDGFDENWAGHGGWTSGQVVLGDVLDPYLKSKQIWGCPSDSGVKTSRVAGQRWSSYHFRHFLSSPPNYNWNFAFTDASLSTPSSIFMFCETAVDNHDKTKDAAGNSLGVSNFAFADGHVKAMRNDKVIQSNGDYHWPRNGWATNNLPAQLDPNPDI